MASIFFFFFFCFHFFFFEVQLIYNVVSISAVQQSDSVLYIQTFFFKYSFPLWFIPEIGCSSLCYTDGPCCLSILNVRVCIYQPQIPSPSLSLPTPLGNHKSVLYVCESLSQICSFVSIFQIPYISDTIWYLSFFL